MMIEVKAFTFTNDIIFINEMGRAVKMVRRLLRPRPTSFERLLNADANKQRSAAAADEVDWQGLAAPRRFVESMVSGSFTIEVLNLIAPMCMASIFAERRLVPDISGRIWVLVVSFNEYAIEFLSRIWPAIFASHRFAGVKRIGAVNSLAILGLTHF